MVESLMSQQEPGPGEPEPGSVLSCMLVHGWGMNHSIWQPVLERLAMLGMDINAVAIDLPGHGQNHEQSFNGLQDLSHQLEQQLLELRKAPGSLVVVAWSLGALPVMQLALQKPHLIDGILLVSASPCFVRREDWSIGVEAQVFDQFANSLRHDFSGTIRRFLSLQVKGSEAGRQLLRGLREKVLQQPPANIHSLEEGLVLLKKVDLRAQLSQIQIPVSWVLGEQDGLVKAALAEELKTLMPGASVTLYEKAGHAPFLSSPDEFAKQLQRFALSILNES